MANWVQKKLNVLSNILNGKLWKNSNITYHTRPWSIALNSA